LSGQDGVKGMMIPPYRGSVNSPSSWQYTSPGGHVQSHATGTDASKRSRVEAARYETSDTRTNVRDDENGLSNRQAVPTPMNYFPPSTDHLATPQQTMTFDIGGVTFDGLDMLQGFSASDPSNFWDTFLQPQYTMTPNFPAPEVPQGVYHVSGQTTPISTPGIAQGLGQSHVLHNNAPGGDMSWDGGNIGGSGMGMDGLEFWSQVGEGRFDWGADPSVPFNV
jgi:hypothetical protein